MTPYYTDDTVTLLLGDAAEQAATLAPASVQTVVTSPPYFGLRNYGVDGQLGAESSPSEFVANLVAVFEAIRPALSDDGVLWVNLGDSYNAKPGQRKVGDKAGAKQSSKRGSVDSPSRSVDGVAAKNLLGIPWRFAFAMQDAGWVLRNDIIWAKPNGMPESVRDRFSTKHEHIFLFAKSPRYYFDLDAVRRPLAESSVARLAQDVENQAGSTRGNGGAKTNGAMKAVRAQTARAVDLFREHGLTEAHLDAMRAVGMSDAGKAKARQSGSGRNAPEIQRLADEAKAALGGYYREFLSEGANPGDWWEIATRPFSGAHFAVFPPEIPERCILASTRPAGKRCDCDEVIGSPTGERAGDDPTSTTGRAGMNRPRGDNEGRRLVTRRTQRHHANELRDSPHRSKIEAMAGSAFAHYVRTDAAGARPLPPALMDDLLTRGWITMPTPCDCPERPGDTVLDPFSGSGTTGMVATKHGRRYIGIDLNADYHELALKTRLAQGVLS